VRAIKIDGPAAFQQSVKDVLTKIRSNLIGQIIASSIEGIEDKDLTIVPFDAGKAAVLGSCNASAKADSPLDKAPKGISGDLRGESAWYVGKEDDPNTREDERYTRVPSGLKGTGAGSDVHLFFTPDSRGRSGCGGGDFGSCPTKHSCTRWFIRCGICKEKRIRFQRRALCGGMTTKKSFSPLSSRMSTCRSIIKPIFAPIMTDSKHSTAP
jgi:hypothetical protein